MGGYLEAWAAYTCAMYGHLFIWNHYLSNEPPPKGCVCQRCGAVNGGTSVYS